MSAFSVIVALALGGGVIVAAAAEPDTWLVQFQYFSPSKYFREIAGPKLPVHAALNSETAWRAFWREIEPSLPRDMTQKNPHRMPSIDFSRYTLIVVAMGERPTGGYSAAIQSVTESPTGMRVAVIELEPGGCMGTTLATTRPVALALVPRTTKTFYFDVSRSESVCESAGR